MYDENILAEFCFLESHMENQSHISSVLCLTRGDGGMTSTMDKYNKREWCG